MQGDQEVLITRAEFWEKTRKDKSSTCTSWCVEERKRTTEYDAIHEFLWDYSVKVTQDEKKPFSVLDAAERVAQEKKIGGKGSKQVKTIYGFMKDCEKYRRKKRADEKAAKEAAEAAAAAAAAESGEQQEEVVCG
jgi:hypothetical protein